MKTVRIIPRLDIKGPNLVKGIHLEGLRVLGKPEEFARYYYENGADELIYMDVVASLFERNSLEDIISRTAKEIFIPLTVGGGLRNTIDIYNVLRAGADKVCINTAAIRNPDIIREASNKFGSSTIVIAIEAIKQPDGKYLCYIDNGRQYTGVDVFDWAERVCSLGAGEIVITSVDNEGTGNGYDLELIRKVSRSVNIPVIAHGGAGSENDVLNAVKVGFADAVALASILHYDYVANRKFVDSSVNEEGNVEFLRKGKAFNKIKQCDLKTLKSFLIENNIECRI
jgi:cyclase